MYTTKKKSQLQEKRIAKQFKGKTVVASGSIWSNKGDVRSDKFLIECKTTDTKHYSLSAKTWEKIEQEAVRDNLRIPLMSIDVQGNSFIVFKPQDFNTHISMCGERVSYRITPDIMDSSTGIFVSEYSGVSVGYPYFAFCICGKKENVLCCMKLKDFQECFNNFM